MFLFLIDFLMFLLLYMFFWCFCVACCRRRTLSWRIWNWSLFVLNFLMVLLQLAWKNDKSLKKDICHYIRLIFQCCCVACWKNDKDWKRRSLLFFHGCCEVGAKINISWKLNNWVVIVSQRLFNVHCVAWWKNAISWKITNLVLFCIDL